MTATIEATLALAERFRVDPEWYARTRSFYDDLQGRNPGYLLGRYLNPYRGGEAVHLVDRSDRFVGVYMPTRAGKGVSFAIPNALTWEHSLFVNDPKGEIAAATAWWRKYKLGNRVFVVDPGCRDGTNARVNFLSEIRPRTAFEVADAYGLATQTCDPDGSGYEGETGVWKKRARDLSSAGMLHVLYSPRYPRKSMSSVNQLFNQPGKTMTEVYDEMITEIHDPEGVMGWVDASGRPTRTHPYIAEKATSQKNRPEGEAGSVKSELESYFSLYSDPIVAENTAVSDFSIADAMNGLVPTTIYYRGDPGKLEEYKPFTRTLINLLINRNIGPLSFDYHARPIKPYRWKMAILADEFTSTWGQLKVFGNSLAFIAGYGIKPAIIVQDMEQLIETYGVHQNIISNMHTNVIGAMNNLASARYFSEMFGQFRYYREAESFHNGSRTVSWQPEDVDLLSTAQMTRIPQDETIVKMAGRHPIPMKKLKYYDEDSNFAHRVRVMDFASDRLPRNAQAGYAERVAAETEWRDKARSAQVATTLNPTQRTSEMTQAKRAADFAELAKQFGHTAESAIANEPDDDAA